MTEWQQRVVDESKELNERFDKLTAFLAVPHPDVTEVDLQLLLEQHDAMRDYADVLHRRILRFKAR